MFADTSQIQTEAFLTSNMFITKISTIYDFTSQQINYEEQRKLSREVCVGKLDMSKFQGLV